MVGRDIWNSYVESAAAQYGVPPALVSSVIGAESSWRPGVEGPVTRSGQRAGGMMQLMPDTFAEVRQKYGLGPDRFDPQTNIQAGTAYLGQLYKQFGNWPDAIAAYNAGPGRWGQVKAGKADAPRETTNYVAKVTAGFDQGQMPARDVAAVPAPQAVDEGANMPFFSGPAQRHGSLTGLLEVDQENNFYEGLGGIWNAGQTPSQPPRTDPATAPGFGQAELGPRTQTDRLGIGSRMNDILQQLLEPQRPALSPLQYQLAGAGNAVGKLAGVTDRRVGIGELLGALGGGLTSGAAAGEQAQREDLQGQLGNLTSAAKIQEFQREQTTQASRAEAARQLAAQLRQSGDPQKVALAAAVERDPSLMDKIVGQQAKAAFPDALNPSDRFKVVGNTLVDVTTQQPVYTGAPTTRPQTVSTAEGVFLLNPDGSLGQRYGSTVNGISVNVGTGGGTQEERQAVARSAGLPAPTTSPYDNPNLSVAGKEKLALALQKQAEDRFKGNDETVTKANQANADLQRFTFLNETNDTGGITSSPIFSGVRGYVDSEFKEMQAITAKLAPTMRTPGSGATSDFDAAQFERATVGVDKPRETNANIAKGMMVGNQNLIAKAQFERAYFDAHQHLQGADEAWQTYLNANPIFDPKAPAGSMTLNANRQDWRTFFSGGGKAPGQQAPQTDAANDPLGLR